MHVHYGYNPDAVRFLQIDHRIGEHIGEVSSRIAFKYSEAFRMTADFVDQSLDLIIKTTTQLQLNGSVILGRLRILRGSTRMED